MCQQLFIYLCTPQSGERKIRRKDKLEDESGWSESTIQQENVYPIRLGEIDVINYIRMLL